MIDLIPLLLSSIAMLILAGTVLWTIFRKPPAWAQPEPPAHAAPEFDSRAYSFIEHLPAPPDPPQSAP